MQEEILNYLRVNPSASRKELAENINGSTIYGIRYNLERLKKLGLIRRVGADKGGFWVVSTDFD